MDSRRVVAASLSCLAWVYFASGLAAAETATKHTLRAARRQGETMRVDVVLQVGGDLKLMSDGKPKTLPMSATANLRYDEQILALDTARRPVRSVRYYDEARAAIKVDQGGEKPTLDPARRLIAVDKPGKQGALLYCPAEPLRREDLDLLDVPGNTLLLDQLLPAEAVALGGSWKLADQTLAELLSLEAVSWSDVQSVLGEIKDGQAEIASAGSVSGAVGGVSTEIEMKAKCYFDLKAERITYLALLIKEKRSIGHIGPGLDTVAKLIVRLQPLAASDHLTPATLETVRESSGAAAAQLTYASPAGRFSFDYDRRWYLTTDDSKLTVLRLLDRGELIAQCNVSALPPVAKQPVTLAEFQHDVQASLGKTFGQFINASENTTDAGYRVFRVVAQGTVSQLPIQWIYYLVVDKAGHRVSLAFTLEQNLDKQFAQADRALTGQLRLLEPASPTAAKASLTK